MGMATQRYLQQKEAIEAAGIDGHRTAIGDIVDGEAAEVGAVVMRVKARIAAPGRRQPMRAEDAADLIGGFIDIRGADAGEGGQPGRRRAVAH